MITGTILLAIGLVFGLLGFVLKNTFKFIFYILKYVLFAIAIVFLFTGGSGILATIAIVFIVMMALRIVFNSKFLSTLFAILANVAMVVLIVYMITQIVQTL